MPNPRRSLTLASLLLVAGALIAFFTGTRNPPPRRLVLATTTSVADSGLLSVLLPPFERARGLQVNVLAVGTGQALAVARRGDADVVLVHAPELEQEFLRGGYGTLRTCIASNTFAIAGPASDPAGIRGARDAASAFARIARGRALFVSRGDGSGTEIKEREIWRKAGLDPAGQAWYLASGAGMGTTLTLASEKQAYTLTDTSTYLALEPRLRLALLYPPEGRVDPLLINQYNSHRREPRQVPSRELRGCPGAARLPALPGGPAHDRHLQVGSLPPPPLHSFTRTVPPMSEIVVRTLQVSITAVLLASALGIPLGTFLGMREFPAKRIVLTVLYTGMGLPPVVVGLVVYLLLSHQGPLGWLHWLFTPSAMVLAEMLLAVPLVAGVTMTAVSAVDRSIREAALMDGANWRQVGLILIREARFGVIVAIVAGFGRAISEVGAVLMVGGDIEGYTRVMTTAIVLETRKGNFELATALGLLLLGISFAVNLTLQLLQPGIHGGAP